jgi:hypothetical protein
MRREENMQKRIFLSYRWIFTAIMVVALTFGGFANAQAAPFFKGKVITFIVPYSPGGGTDVFARLVARHIREHIPGEPSVVVRNVPGGGALIGGNLGWSRRPDGKTVLVTSGTTVMQNILRPKGTQFKLHEMIPLYSAPIGNVYFVNTKIGIKKPIDIMTADNLIFGHINPTGGTGGGFAWPRALLKFKAKEIWGYGGSGDSRLAFLSGELNCSGGSTIDYNANMIQYEEKGEIVPIYQSGILDANGDIVREPAAPDLPTPVELYEQFYKKKPSGDFLDSYKLIVGSRTFGKTLVIRQEVPQKIVKIYQKAVAGMVKDPKFLKDAERLLPGAPHFLGKSLRQAYTKGVSGPPETIAFMKKYLTEKYNVPFD